MVAEPGGAGPQPVGDGLGDVLGLVLQGERAVTELGGLLVGAGDVAAAGDAVVQAGGVLDSLAVAEGPVPLVVAEHEGMRVVIDHGVLVRQQLAGAGEGDGGAGEAGGRGGGLDGAAGGGPGYAAAVSEVVVQGRDGVGDRAGGLKVDKVVDAVAAAGAVFLGCPVEGGAHVPVLDGQGDQAVGPARDVPGQGPPEAAAAMFPCGSAGMTSPARPWLAASRLARHEVLDPVPSADTFGTSAGPAARQVVGVMIEQQVPCGTIRSKTRMALTTGVMATQGASRSAPPD